MQFALGLWFLFIPNTYIGILILSLFTIGPFAVNEVSGRGWGQQAWIGVGKFTGAIILFATLASAIAFLAWKSMANI